MPLSSKTLRGVPFFDHRSRLLLYTLINLQMTNIAFEIYTNSRPAWNSVFLYLSCNAKRRKKTELINIPLSVYSSVRSPACRGAITQADSSIIASQDIRSSPVVAGHR